MPCFQHPAHVSKTQPPGAQRHRQVEDQVRRFAEQGFVVLGHHSQGSLDTFLAHLLRHAAQAAFE